MSLPLKTFRPSLQLASLSATRNASVIRTITVVHSYMLCKFIDASVAISFSVALRPYSAIGQYTHIFLSVFFSANKDKSYFDSSLHTVS